jgi:hypothetical protein
MATHAVSVNYNLQLDATETLALSLDLETGTPKITHKIDGTVDSDALPAAAGTLNASSTPAATQVASDLITLTAGAHTIDLTAAPTRDGDTVDLSGLKVQAIKIACPTGNTEVVKLSAGASNGYNLGGDADWELPIYPGGQAVWIAPEGSPDVAAGAKEIDVASDDADAKFAIIIVAG